MNLGHSAEIDREILAYPYPGRSANNRRGSRAVAVSDRAKKLIARVRPGEDETLAAFSPSNPLIRLDLPTLDRPRKANSGALAEGNCSGAIADNRNLVTRCIPAYWARGCPTGAGGGTAASASGVSSRNSGSGPSSAILRTSSI